MTELPLFAAAHDAYLDAGWSGVLVLPAGTKGPPPTGFTGAEGRWPARNDIARWARDNPHGNIALRLSRDVIGIDFDLYRDPRARVELEELTGPLPPTWCSTSKVDGSGIRFYRVPPLSDGVVWRSGGHGYDIVQHHHRYAVVWPSIHPDGNLYRWIDEVSGEVMDRPPEFDDLTDLPWAAQVALLVPRDAAEHRAPIALELPAGEMSVTVERRLMAAVAATKGAKGSRHDAACRDVTALLRLAERGEPGVDLALDMLREAFVGSVTGDRPGGADAALREFDIIVEGGRGLVAGTVGRIPTRAERDAEWQALRHIELGPRATTPPGGAEAPMGEIVDPLNVIRWERFWAADGQGEDWLLEPLIARGRGHALYAGAKSGKSLLMLAACAALATGRAFLNNGPRPPQHVLYVDYEMTEDDLRERLETFGYGPDDDLECLHYALLPTIDPLDTISGADVVLDAARRYQAVHVVIDTTSRAISGEENSADTFRAFYRHCGLPLKSAGIGYHRLDHSGKDIGKGQRGSSAKNDDVDVVQQLVPRDKGGVTIRATHRRMSWVPESVDIGRAEVDGVLGYSTDVTTHPTGTFDVVRWLDGHEIDPTLARRAVKTILNDAGVRCSNDALGAAIKVRRGRENGPILDDFLVRSGHGPRVIHNPRTEATDQTDQTQNPWSDGPDHAPDHSGPLPRPVGVVASTLVLDHAGATNDDDATTLDYDPDDPFADLGL